MYFTGNGQAVNEGVKEIISGTYPEDFKINSISGTHIEIAVKTATEVDALYLRPYARRMIKSFSKMGLKRE